MNNTTKDMEKGTKGFVNGLYKVSADYKNGERNLQHAWYTPDHLSFAFDAFARSLENSLSGLIKSKANTTDTIAVVIKNDAPLEGFDLLLFLLMSGFTCQVSIPTAQEELLNQFLSLLSEHLPAISARVKSVNQPFPTAPRVLFSGTEVNDTLNKYLKTKKVLRINGNNIPALLTGEETIPELQLLARDMNMHFGRAADSINQLRVPCDYDFKRLIQANEGFSENRNHSRYFNHYEYQKAAMLINRAPHYDTGHLLLCNDENYKGKIAVVTWQIYENAEYSSLITENQPVFGGSGTRFFNYNSALIHWLQDE